MTDTSQKRQTEAGCFSAFAKITERVKVRGVNATISLQHFEHWSLEDEDAGYLKYWSEVTDTYIVSISMEDMNI